MNSNRDYATENMNLQKENAELKDQVAYLKEEVEGWQSAYEWSQAQNSILKLKNQELKDKLNSQDLDIWQLHNKYGIYKKAICWLKQNLNFKIEKHKSSPNCMFVSYKDLQEWLEPSNEMVDLLKEVLE